MKNVGFLLLFIGCANVAAAHELLALELVQLTGLEHEIIQVNPSTIVAVRLPLERYRLLAAEANCQLMTLDGKFISVIETCAEVRRRLEASK